MIRMNPEQYRAHLMARLQECRQTESAAMEAIRETRQIRHACATVESTMLGTISDVRRMSKQIEATLHELQAKQFIQ